MGWMPYSLTNGCSVTLNRSVMEEGLQSSSHAELRPGDTKQLYPDRDYAVVKSGTIPGLTNNHVLRTMHFLTFEDIGPELIVVSQDTGNYQIWIDSTRDVLSTGGNNNNWFLRKSYGGLSADTFASACVHYGDVYYLGTGQTKDVLHAASTREIGMRAPATVYTNIIGTIKTGSPKIWVDDDQAVYLWTEYDSVNDLESAPVMRVWTSWSGGTPGHNSLDWSASTYSQVNTGSASIPNADKLRIYRMYTGNGDSNSDQYRHAVAVMEGDRQFFGGRIAEVDITATVYEEDVNQTKLDPGIPYPLISRKVGGITIVDEKLVQPGNFDVGVIFKDSFVRNDPDTDDQVIKWSPAGEHEYSPATFFTYFTTVRSDTVVGLQVIRDRMVVLTNGGVWTLSDLPFTGDIQKLTGRWKEQISERFGCVNKTAHVTMNTPSGPVVVWLSQHGLHWTDGDRVDDACPDWDVKGAGITDFTYVTLTDNPRAMRLELRTLTPSFYRWDFYYHPSHLKDGRLKMMGPTTEAQATLFTADGHDGTRFRVYRMIVDNVHQENLTVTTSNLEAVCAPWRAGAGSAGNRFQNPMAEVRVKGLGLSHSKQASNASTVILTRRISGETDHSEANNISNSLDQDETTWAGAEMRGNEIEAKLVITGSQDGSVGPLWVDASGEDGGHGSRG